METEKILVTGGAGFIGTNLVNCRKRSFDEMYRKEEILKDDFRAAKDTFKSTSAAF
jgi:nucleoside-diphosphate-sugar epimerase